MLSDRDLAGLQAERHPLVDEGEGGTAASQCLHLIHLKAYAESLSLASGRRVLDLGCNVGYGSVVLASVARFVVGVDVEAHAIAHARRSRSADNLRFLTVGAQGLPFRAGGFDVVTAFQVIEHVSDTDRFLVEVGRVLSPGGVAVFTTPNRELRLEPGMRPWNPFHVREYAAEELAAVLRQQFAEVTVTGLQASPGLYAIESARVMAAREEARGSRRTAPLAQRAFRAFWRRLARAWRRRLPGSTSVPYSLQDLRYSDDHLKTALDLRAVCRGARRSA